jgi:hypothetical protein
LISVHWIPTHRGQEDKERFARWNPAFVKVVCVDERPPYMEDIPLSAKIIIRNHPMSEMYGSRGWVAGMGLTSASSVTEQYESYFSDYLQKQTWTREGFAASDASGTTTSPEITGKQHADACKRMADYCESQGVFRLRLLFEGLNEPQLWAGEAPDLTARYYKAFLLGLHGYGLHGVVGNFGVGWPGNGGIQDAPVDWNFFKPVIDIFQPGDYLGLHEYWALNGPEQNWKWWGGRFLQCPYQVPILITECGIDTGVTGQWYGGWGDLPGTYDQKATRYCDELWWYANRCAADGRVKGILPFTYDIGGREWEKFDIRNQPFLEAFWRKVVAEGFPQPGGVQPPPIDPPVPPPVDPPVPPPVQESDWQIVAAVTDSQPNEGVSYILGSNFMVDAMGTRIKPMQKPVQVKWINETDPANWIYPNVAPDGSWSFTPFQNDLVWDVRTVDEVRGIDSGWHRMDLNKRQYRMEFRWTPVFNEPEYASLEEAVRGEAEKNDVLSVNPDAALCKAGNALNLWPTSNEYDFTYNGVAYRGQRFRDPASDRVSVIYCVLNQWDQIQILTW